MNGIYPADLAVYLFLFPISCFVFVTHGLPGFLPWHYVNIFCFARIVGGALGVHDNNSLAAGIIQSVGITPLVLAVDGLVHEARTYRYPAKSRVLDWSVVLVTTGTMVVAVVLSIVGALAIYEDNVKSDSYSLWKAGSALIVLAWLLQVFWSIFSCIPSKWRSSGPEFQESTKLLQGACVALIFIGIRVIYTLVAVCTQRRDLNAVYGTAAVRVVLMFLPEVLATVTMLFVGIRTRHLRQMKGETKH